ncbi:hypothetical protein UlMin_025081, partial [Ulmus minor]
GSRPCPLATSHVSVALETKIKLGNSGNLEATGVPTSVPVCVAHELLQGGHRYLDVRTPEEFITGHAPGAVNIPYMYKVGSGLSLHYIYSWWICCLDTKCPSHGVVGV